MIAVYPGSFDPVTSGHQDIICRAASIFEQVTVVVAGNSAKTPVFPTDERLEMLRAVTADLPNVTVDVLSEGLLVDFAQARGARVIVKGLRAVSDFEYEFQLALLNRSMQPSVETMFLATSTEHSFLSSSIVKEIARLGGKIDGLVPDAIVPLVLRRFGRER